MSDDILIVGAGLSGSLAAIACARQNRGVKLRLIDGAPAPGQHETWSFHDTDVSAHWRETLSPGLRAHWPRQRVRFPTYDRDLPIGYNSMDGAGLDRVRLDAGVQVDWNSPVAQITDTQAQLTCGKHLRAACVIDARGAEPSAHLVAGFQKFAGLEIETTAPHGIDAPVIMDAAIDQIDGYRFIYLLPFSPTRILIEDTRYSDGDDLDVTELEAGIWAYAAQRGWRGSQVRAERGVLPIALAHDAAGFWRKAEGGAVPIGLRAALFHPVTGYSLPDAARTADIIAAHAHDAGGIFDAVRRASLAKARRERFLRLLSRMLFRGCAPDQRRRVMSRFYRLPHPLIERFYASRLTRWDRLRIVAGKPPISVRRAITCLPETPQFKDLTQ